MCGNFNTCMLFRNCPHGIILLYWLSWSNGYDICLPKYKDASRGSEFDSRWEQGHLGKSGTTIFLVFYVSSFRVSTTPTATDATTSKIFCFKIRGPLVSSVRARPKTMAGKKKNCNCRNSRCLKLYATYRETFRYHRASLTALLALGAQVL